MQKMLLMGRAEVSAKKFCDNYRCPKPSDGGSKRKKIAFPRKAWEEVVAAAFAQFPVGQLVGQGTPHCKAVFYAPPPAMAARSTKVRYHNLLVDMCQVSARKFSTLLSEHVLVADPA